MAGLQEMPCPATRDHAWTARILAQKTFFSRLQYNVQQWAFHWFGTTKLKEI